MPVAAAEKEVQRELGAKTGKPQNIVEKMIAGRLNKVFIFLIELDTRPAPL